MKRKTGEELQIEILRGMNADQKLKLAADLRRLNLELLESGIRSRENNLTEEEIKLRMLQYVLPPELFERFYAPSHAG